MNRKEQFLEMLTRAKDQEFGYIGTGNPEARILIIGKEVAIDKEKDSHSMTEYENNLNFWERDREKTMWDIALRNRDEYSPLCPFKGQYQIKYNGKDNWGTSTTWLNYQKLHNYIFGNSLERINFHKNIFTTEINGVPSANTKEADKSTIEKRKLFIKDSKYFQNFPVIILAGVGYYDISETENDIEKIFGVKFTKPKRIAGGNEKQPYWVHWNNDKTKLVINTYQLSINISDALLEEIAELIKSVLESISDDFSTEESSKNAEERWNKGGKEIYENIQSDPNFENSKDYKDYVTWVYDFKHLNSEIEL